MATQHTHEHPLRVSRVLLFEGTLDEQRNRKREVGIEPMTWSDKNDGIYNQFGKNKNCGMPWLLGSVQIWFDTVQRLKRIC